MIKIFKNALKTERAFIHYDKIQHFSWNFQEGMIELKVYSSAGTIIQLIDSTDYTEFCNSYVRDWLGIGGLLDE